MLADHIVPTAWADGVLRAYPRAAPVLVSDRRARRRELEGVKVRALSDAVRVDVARVTSPQPVQAIASVGVRRPGETVLDELVGHERFSAAASVMIGGVMAPESTDADRGRMMSEHLELAKLRFATLRFDEDTLGADVAELCNWWSDLAEHGMSG